MYAYVYRWAWSNRPSFRDRFNGRCYGKRFSRKSAKICIPHPHSVRWHSTTDGRIATRMYALTPSMTPLRPIKIRWTLDFGPVIPEFCWQFAPCGLTLGFATPVVDFVNAMLDWGFADNGEYWRSGFEMDDLKETVDKLWQQVRPLYQQLHAYVRRKLLDVYSQHRDHFPASRHIPAHLFGQSRERWIFIVVLSTNELQSFAWLSGRTSVFGRRTFSVLRSTCSW